ncbi:hypothetical protein HBI59_153030 [Parastagonospora nodorum]|nr:hypothetical protein HBI78_240120 [Parastagonospora nodorum]KAH6438832.1 hypothetical protein HBI59_153030 [Parastagonospora nodorum]
MEVGRISETAPSGTHLPQFDTGSASLYCKVQHEPTVKTHTSSSVHDLEDAAKAGCLSCAIILLGARKLYPEQFQHFIYKVCDRQGIILVKYLDSVSRSKGKPPSMPGIHLLTLVNTPACLLPVVSVGRNTPERCSMEWLPILSRWLADCTANHNCGISGAQLPTRVLDVGTSLQDPIRLYISRGESARYIAFSHCWGEKGPAPAVTTKSNLHHHIEGFDVGILPKSFLEVISIARNLHVQFVWIDSLCIIQDDANDWDSESGRMATVYSNAHLVVAASSASDSSEGFISSPCHNPALPVATMRNDDGSLSTIHVRSEYASHQELGPLDSRGWALQERALSRRLVDFRRYEMFWECTRCSFCECGQSFSQVGPKTIFHRPESSFCWSDLRKANLQKALTHSSDFLPALSGIVSHMQNFGAGDYLAGLWRTRLIDQLLWGFWSRPVGLPSAMLAGAGRIQPYRAPTWSWASLDTQNGRHMKLGHNASGMLSDVICRLLHASCTPRGRDENGAVTSGKIVLEGKLIKFICREHALDGQNVLHVQDMRHASWPEHVTLTILEAPFDLAEESYKDIELYGIALVRHLNSDVIKSVITYIGITLQMFDKKLGIYERVGVWKGMFSDGFRSGDDKTSQFAISTAHRFEEARTLAHMPDTTITII